MSRVTLSCSRTVAREYLRQVLDAMAKLPDRYDRLLGERDVDVYLGRRWTDIWPDWEPESSKQPEWSAYDSMAEIGAYYLRSESRVMMVAEYMEDGAYTSDRQNARRTLNHELGHALDHTSEPRPSQDCEFRRLYLAEREQVKHLELLRHFCHPWARGALEVFASAFAAHAGPIYYEELRDHFAESFAWVADYAESASEPHRPEDGR